jgi:hypothetical protein
MRELTSNARNKVYTDKYSVPASYLFPIEQV